MERENGDFFHRLAMESPEQIDRFRKLARSFTQNYAFVREYEGGRYVRDDWSARNLELKRHLLPEPELSFLHLPDIRYQMFVGDTCASEELRFLAHMRIDRSILREDPIGSPPLLLDVDGVITSPNMVHHVHHLKRFESATNTTCSSLPTVLEWGGGYGSLARLFRRMTVFAPTYVIVDTPLFSTLQWLYLSSLFGIGATNLMSQRSPKPRRGRFNLLPVGLVDTVELTPDIFISTWGLNESSDDAQYTVLERQWFGAKHLLLGMHDSHPLAAAAIKHGGHTEPVGNCMPAQRYTFR